MIGPCIRLVPLLLAFAGAQIASAQGLVILSRGTVAAAHPVGSTLRPGTVLALGDRIDVLERGGTRRLDGPAVYVSIARTSAAQNVRLVVTQLLDRRRDAPVDDRRRPANVRGAPAAGVESADARAAARVRYAGGIWTVDAEVAGTTCFRSGEPPRIRRPAAAAPADAILAAIDGSVTVPVRWVAGADAAAWPTPLPAAARDYTLRAPDGASTRVRLVPLAPAATLDDLVVALDGAGCGAQLGFLLDQYPVAAAPAR